MMDKEAFKENYKVFDPEIILEIINIFMDEYQGRLSKLQQSFNEKAYQTFKFDIHAFKGVIGNFTTGTPFEQAKILEQFAEEKLSETTAVTEKQFQYGLDDFRVSVIHLAGELNELKNEYQ